MRKIRSCPCIVGSSSTVLLLLLFSDLNFEWTAIPAAPPRVFPLALDWSDYPTPVQHSQTHTLWLKSLTGQAWRCLSSLFFNSVEAAWTGGGAAWCLDGEPGDFTHRSVTVSTGGSVGSMELGRAWSRFQRMLLITMMMFKLGKMWTLFYPTQWIDSLENGYTFRSLE